MSKDGKSSKCNHCRACLDCQMVKSYPVVNEAVTKFIHIHNTTKDEAAMKEMYYAAMQAKAMLIQFDREIKGLKIDA